MKRATLVLAILCALVVMASLAACTEGLPAEPTIIPLPNSPEQIPTLECLPTPTPRPTQPPTATSIPPSASPTPSVVPTAPPGVLHPSPTPTPALSGRFVFQQASGGDIYVVNADGTGLLHLTRGMDPAWSPDGTKVAFVRWTAPWGIYIISADGTGEKLLFSSDVARAPVWSPEGGQIAFYFETVGLAPPWKEYIEGYGWLTLIPAQEQTEWHLGVLDVADGYFRQPYCDRFSFSPTWSDDGKWLTYDGDHGLSKTTVEGPNNLQFSDNVHDHFPVTSPVGDRIAFMHWQHDHWEIYVMNSDGSGRRALTGSSALLETRPNNVSPTWSPDGQWIAFLSDRGGEWEFYVMRADGSDQRQILGHVTEQMEISYRGSNERMISWGP